MANCSPESGAHQPGRVPTTLIVWLSESWDSGDLKRDLP